MDVSFLLWLKHYPPMSNLVLFSTRVLESTLSVPVLIPFLNRSSVGFRALTAVIPLGLLLKLRDSMKRVDVRGTELQGSVSLFSHPRRTLHCHSCHTEAEIERATSSAEGSLSSDMKHVGSQIRSPLPAD